MDTEIFLSNSELRGSSKRMKKMMAMVETEQFLAFDYENELI